MKEGTESVPIMPVISNGTGGPSNLECQDVRGQAPALNPPNMRHWQTAAVVFQHPRLPAWSGRQGAGVTCGVTDENCGRPAAEDGRLGPCP